MDRIAQEKNQIEKEAEELSANIAQHQLLVDEEQKNLIKNNLSYQADLLEQIQFKEGLKVKEKEERIREELMAREAERLHQQRVENALLKPDITKTHPQRLLLTKRT